MSRKNSTERRSKRLSGIDDEISVTFKVDRSRKSASGVLSNVSHGGVFIETPQKLDEGTVVDLKVSIPQRFLEVSAKGRVVWQGRQEGKTGIGVEFVDIDPIQLYDLMRGVKSGGWLYAFGVLKE